MYAVPRLAYGMEEVEEESMSVCKHFHLVVLERQEEALIDKEVNRGFVFIWHMKVTLFHKLKHRPSCKLLETTLAH